jgi:hypothetical protein
MTEEAQQYPAMYLPVVKVELAVGDNEVRYYLNHPFLDLRHGKPTLVATNGHFLLAAEVEIEGTVEEGPVPLRAIQAARKRGANHGTLRPVLYFDREMCGTGDAMFRRPKYDFKYPEWWKVVPNVDTNQKPDIAFSGRYIKTMAKALCSGGVSLYISRNEHAKEPDPTKAITVRSAVNIHGAASSEAPAYHAVLMPMRFDS